MKTWKAVCPRKEYDSAIADPTMIMISKAGTNVSNNKIS